MYTFVILKSSEKTVSPKTEFCFPGVPPISEDDEGSAFPGESPSKGYMEARKLIE